MRCPRSSAVSPPAPALSLAAIPPEDPAVYRKFSEMLEDAIRAFREKRLSDAEYLRKVSSIRDAVRDRRALTIDYYAASKS